MEISPGLSAKVLLLNEMLAQKVRPAELARRMKVTPQEVNRLTNLRYGSKIDGIAAAAKALLTATGEVLYGLTTLGRDRTDASVQKACKYLLGTQKPDGSWHMTRKMFSTLVKEPSPKSNDAVYTYWATGWAVVGLLQTLPE